MSPARYARKATAWSPGAWPQPPETDHPHGTNTEAYVALDKMLRSPAARVEPHYQSSIAAMRVLAAFAVVALHVAGRALVDAGHGSSSWWVANLYRASTCWCVPVFVMISGALLLNPQQLKPAAVFYKKRMSKILIPLAFWTVLYLALRACTESLSWPEAGRDVVRAQPYGHLWFLFMIAGLYFVTPLLQPFVRSATHREQTWIIVSLLAAGSVYDLICQFTGGFGRPTMFSMFITYVPYYLCGSLLYRTVVSARWMKYLAAGVVATWLGIAVGTGLIFPRQYFYGWHNPLTILMSVGVFLVGSSLLHRREGRGNIIRYLDSISLGVYLIHPLIIFGLKEVGHYGEHLAQWPILSIPAMSLFIIAVSAILTSGLKAIPVVRRVV
jgi:surface polysaccharide O-acyltransferase-like enzyme